MSVALQSCTHSFCFYHNYFAITYITIDHKSAPQNSHRTLQSVANLYNKSNKNANKRQKVLKFK